MFYEPSKRNHGLPHDPLLAIVTPRPIGWISTISPDGVFNLAPYSFFNLFSSRPPIVGFSNSGPRKHSLDHAAASGEFVCNLVVEPLMEAMNLTSKHIPVGESEFELSGLTPVPGTMVKTPRVKESPCALECVWIESKVICGKDGQPSANVLTLGEVVGIHIDEQFIVDGRLDAALMRSVARCGYLDYAMVESLHPLPRPD